MVISDFERLISIGNLPLTIFQTPIYKGLYRFIRVTENNTVFIDIETPDTEEGGFRATFQYGSLKQMISSLEQYSGIKLSEWRVLLDAPESDVIDNADIAQFRLDLYEHRISFPEGADSFIIGDLYWSALYNHEIDPDASFDEILQLLESKQEE